MAAVPLALLELSWLRHGQNFVHAVRRLMWDNVVEQPEEKIKENYQGLEQQAAQNSLRALESSEKANKTELAKRLI